MTDSPRRDGPEPTQPLGGGYPGYPDPAYANEASYGPRYQGPPGPLPTERMPAYAPPYGYDPYATGQYGGQYPPGAPPPPPEGPQAPRWLWVVAAVAVVVVVGLVIALVILKSSEQQTVVAPLPPLEEPSFTTSAPTTTSRAPIPTLPVLPFPTSPPTATESAPPGATESVIYEVTGDGRAINITYVDSGGILQTEFNVMLPWTREVELAMPAQDSASVSVINVGPEVTCTVTVNGELIQQRTAAGLTICAATG